MQVELLTSMGFPADAAAAALEAYRGRWHACFVNAIRLVCNKAAGGDTNAAANSLLADRLVD